MIIRVCIAFAIASYLSLSGFKKQRLSLDGALAAFVVGFVSFSAGYVYGITLIVFYFTSSKLTKYKESVKKELEEEYKIGGQRNATQVLVNSLNATLLAVVLFFLHHAMDSSVDHELPICMDSLGNSSTYQHSLLLMAFLGHFAACNGDTWSSEIGSAFSKSPRLITTLRKVPAGTNGGISLPGVLAAAGGGLCIGFTVFVCAVLESFFLGVPCQAPQWPVILLGLFGGLFGSLFDSLLGATVQATYFNAKTKKITSKSGKAATKISGFDFLNNDGVNYVSNTVTAVVLPLVAHWCF